MLAIIPARGGSQRIERKNIKPFKGKPMMQWAIEAARYADIFDEIVVSTDDEEIRRTALHLECNVYWRQQDDGSRGTQDVAAQVLRHDVFASTTEACVIYPCSPMLLPTDLQQAHADLKALDAVYAMSVLTDPLADAGMFYFGLADAFRSGAPLIHQHTVMIPIPPTRGIDINTPEDWSRAEAMFDALRRADAQR